MTPEGIPEPWRSFLAELDGALSEDLSVHCMGGFVVSLVYGLQRSTSDIDILSVISTDRALATLTGLGCKGSPLHKKYGIYLDVVTVAQVPESYEERLSEMFPGTFRHLRMFALDPYDLALSKLERNFQRDRDDVKYLAKAVPLDLATLQKRYQKELRQFLGRPEREDLTLKLWIEAIEEERHLNY